MPELMIDVITSLDAFAAAEDWPGLWGMGGPEYAAWLEQDAARPATLLLGATTYRLFAGFAESGEEEGIASLTAMDKVVFSSTLTEPLTWDNTRLVRGDAAAEVAAMKRDGTRQLRTTGSLSLCRSLVEARLVDRLRVVVFPVVTGASGREPFFARWPDVVLDPVDHRVLDGRLQMTEFVPRVLDEPPGA